MAELATLRRMVERLVPEPLTPQRRAVVDVLYELYGCEPFTTAELIRKCDLALSPRPEVRAALVALCGCLDVQKVGLALRRIAELGGISGAARLTAPRSERNRRVWCCEVLRD